MLRADSPQDILGKSPLAELRQELTSLRTELDLIRSEHAEQEYLTQPVSGPMPTPSVAPRASGEAILRALGPAFMSLDDVVNFPVTARFLCPAPLPEND
jgi:hypothetical protein